MFLQGSALFQRNDEAEHTDTEEDSRADTVSPVWPDLEKHPVQGRPDIPGQRSDTLRKLENINLRQRLIPWTEDQTVPYPKTASVSL